MKKILLASTVLAATAGAASADVTVGGFGYVGVIHNSALATDETYVTHGTRITFAASVETDAGVEFGATSRITITDNNDNGDLGHNKITIKTGAVSVAVGATHGAMNTLARVASFHGFTNGGIGYLNGAGGFDSGNSTFGNVALHDSGNNVLVRYDTGSLSVAAASDVAGNTAELAVKYASNGLSIGLGVNDNDNWQVALGYAAGDFSINLGVNDSEDLVVVASYAVSSATKLTLAFDQQSNGDNVGLNVVHNLGGANLIGTIGSDRNDDTTASLGVQFNF